jgi:F420-0:gamma-glutamyl ligase-like protein
LLYTDHLRNKYKLYIIRKPFRYWFPGTDVVKEIVKVYGNKIRDGDIIVISDKALSIAHGNIYDESTIYVDPITNAMAFITSKILWGYFLKGIFINIDTVKLINETPLKLLAKHKKLALSIGGLKHFLKPLSEAGIDVTNLPYHYVSIPIKNISNVVREIKDAIDRKFLVDINVLVVDTDKCFVPKDIKSLAIASRPSTIKGVIDLGFIAYILGKALKNLFEVFPTPTVYQGIWLGLYTILRLAHIAERFRGHGAGRNIIEMSRMLDVKSFECVTWSSLRKIKHYPVILLRFKNKKLC